MRKFLIRLLKPLKRFYYQFSFDWLKRDSLHQQLQVQMLNQYRLLKHQNNLPPFSETGFRVYSQFEEDGLLLYIFAVIGFQSKKVVEMCCGGGVECMATNLIINHGFEGFLFDGNSVNVANANAFFKSKQDCLLNTPHIQHAWITKENVNDLLINIGATGEVDLFSLDIDGNDYWIWQAIDAIQPRVCIFETQNVIPSDRSITIPYSADFYCWDKKGYEQDFRSVSLLAMTNLSKSKGYRLIGAHRHGFNAIYMRNDIGLNEFPEVSVESVHQNHWTRYCQETIWPHVKDMKWEQV
jgi:hypothetical protein